MSESMSHDDRLLLDVADGTVDDAGWESFQRRAEAHPELWESAVRQTRVEQQLRSAIGTATDVAERVELPKSVPRLASFRRWAGVSGWAAALVVGGLWWLAEASLTTQHSEGALSGDESVATPGLSATDLDRISADAEGTFVQELPRMVLSTRAGEDGAVEVLYIRRTVEKTQLERVYEVGRSDRGALTPVAIPPAKLVGRRRL